MRLSLITLALSLALVGCASTPAPKQRPIVNITPKVEATDQTVVDQATWSIKLPNAWLTTEMAGGGMLARSPDSSLAVAVKFEQLDPEEISDGDFGGAAILAAVSIEGIEVLDARPYTIDGRPGSVALLRLDGGVTMLQYAVGAHRRGYILACGGMGGSRIIEACKPILDTFHAKQ
jgi:hypothetical protein